MSKCAVCVPGLICIPCWDCPKITKLTHIDPGKNAIYYQENKERILDERRLHYRNNKERLKDAKKRRVKTQNE